MTRIGPYLYRNNERSYYVRIAVPEALRDVFGVREIKRKLPTSHLQIARLQASYLSNEILDQFRNTKIMMYIEPSSTLPNALNINNYEPKSYESVAQVLKFMRNNSADDTEFYNTVDKTLGTTFKSKKRLKFSEFFRELCDLLTTNGRWDHRRPNEYKPYVSFFIELLGDRHMDEYDYDNAQAFFTALQKLPKNRFKDPVYRDLPLTRILELSPGGLSADTINKYMSRISFIFKEAVARDLVAKNYFANSNLKKQDNRNDRGKRIIYTPEEIQLIFNSPPLKKPTGKFIEFKWTLLLLLYTGARLNEICQLHVKDIKQEDKIWYIEHNKCCEEKKFKGQVNDDGIYRKTPLHNELLTLGFLDYVKSIVDAGKKDEHGHVRLFPTYTYREDSKYGDKATRFFNGSNQGQGFKHKIGLTDNIKKETKKDIHSFRHTFSTHLQQNGVDESISFFITGHNDNKRAGDLYRKGYTLQQQLEAIEKLSYIHLIERFD